MKRNLTLLALLFSALIASAQNLPAPVQLPNGWRLRPAGSTRTLGDLPLNLALSPRQTYLAALNCGQSVQSLQLFNTRTATLLDSVPLAKTWYGLAFTADEKYLFVSGGNDNCIWKYAIVRNRLQLAYSIGLGKPWPVRISPAGMAVDRAAKNLYVVTRENNALYTIDLATRKVKDSLPIGGEGYTCLLSPDEAILYVSCWGCDKVKLFNTKQRRWTAEISVGDNPNEMLLAKNGRLLYVCNANDNTVSVIDTRERRVIETLDAALYPNSPAGSTTNGLALDANEKKLFIANADNNCVAVFDVEAPGRSRPLGFIPTGWYPTGIRYSGKTLFVTNGKGMTSLPNPNGPSPVRAGQVVRHHQGDTASRINVQYIAGLFRGTLSVIADPSEKTLAQYTKAVYENTPYSTEKALRAEGIAGNPVPRTKGEKSPIKYVFYVIKENRTYDQVLADVKGGNGDTSLLLFGEAITPNQHRLVKDFVLLDNFYVDAEVSADGHNWSMGAYATDYLEKTWPTNYGGRGGRYDAEGNRAIANNKGGFIWDNCKRNGVSFRSYGEFADAGRANVAVLKGHFCRGFAGFDNAIRDTTRFFQWRRDFDSLLAIGAVPSLNTVRFGNDHTEGLKKGRPTPYAHVADNDLAVGMFIAHLSASSIWNETAVFILEDDAQNGADHVDAHRSTAYLAGGFVKRGFIDHTPYTTTSMLRTMELILGLPPMSQYDAAAVPMWRCFDTVSRPYHLQPVIPSVSLNEKNLAENHWQRLSETFNLAKEDAAPDLLFNEVLWHAVKGDKPFPGPRRAAFVRGNAKDDDD